MDTVYLFGAGTSAWAGVPLVSNFKQEADRFRVPSSDEHVVRRFADDRQNALFDRAMDLWDELSATADVEQFYIMAELADRLATEDDPDSWYDLHCAQYLIAKTVAQLAHGEHRRLHDTMLKHVPLQAREITFITLNWDLTLDSAVARSDLFHLDYGLDGIKPLGSGKRKLAVLKLHGSLNWVVRRPGTHLVEPSLDEKSALATWEHELPGNWDITAPHDAPLFVPPTSQKLDDNSGHLASIWRQARSALSNCHRLAIVGYSFPPADAQTRAFVVEALSKNKNAPNIDVVTAPKIGTERLQFEDRYAAAFAGTSHLDRLHFHYVTYEDWVETWRCSFPGPAQPRT